MNSGMLLNAPKATILSAPEESDEVEEDVELELEAVRVEE